MTPRGTNHWKPRGISLLFLAVFQVFDSAISDHGLRAEPRAFLVSRRETIFQRIKNSSLNRSVTRRSTPQFPSHEPRPFTKVHTCRATHVRQTDLLSRKILPRLRSQNSAHRKEEKRERTSFLLWNARVLRSVPQKHDGVPKSNLVFVLSHACTSKHNAIHFVYERHHEIFSLRSQIDKGS